MVTLLAWALVEDDAAERSLVGLVQRPATPDYPIGQTALADEVEGFAGYAVGALQTKPAVERP